jgi:hypothetical protein
MSRCWIDNRRCYWDGKGLTLDHCKLCQKVRLSRYAIKHEQPPIME